MNIRALRNGIVVQELEKRGVLLVKKGTNLDIQDFYLLMFNNFKSQAKENAMVLRFKSSSIIMMLK